MDQEIAEVRAVSILAWMAGHDELFPLFLGASGSSAQDIRDRAGDADFLASVLDFVLMDDAWVLECASDLSLAPEELATIRAALPGGQLPNWT